MTIIIILGFLFFLSSIESGSSSRSSRVKGQTQLKEFKSLEEITKEHLEVIEKQKERKEKEQKERKEKERKEKEQKEQKELRELLHKYNFPEPEPEPEVMVEINERKLDIEPKEDVPFNKQVDPMRQESQAQAVIKEFNKRNITSFWHMTHKDNVASILINGIKNHRAVFKQDGAVDISNPEVQLLRKKPDAIHNRPLHDYVPTYLNIRNPMLYVKKDCNEDICLLEISIECLADGDFVFTDGNAASLVTQFFNTPESVSKLPWDVLNAEYWSDIDDGKRKRCAEVLLHSAIKPKYIKRIHCYSPSTFLSVANPDFKFEIGSNIYF